MFKELGAFGSILRQAQEMGGRFRELSGQLRNRQVTGTAGGGMVEVRMNGLVEVQGCRIDPSLLERNDRELIEDLFAAAVNDAISKAKQLHSEVFSSVTGGLPIPGLQQVLGDFLGGAGGAKDGEDPGKSQP